MLNTKKKPEAVSVLRDMIDNQELSADQRRKLEAAIEELQQQPQGQNPSEALQSAILRIAFWLLLDELI